LCALHEDDTSPHERKQVRPVAQAPAGPRHGERLVGYQQARGLGPRFRHALEIRSTLPTSDKMPCGTQLESKIAALMVRLVDRRTEM
jgi:hypothetical protein